jgi:membrane associated rhomboid family serine protease
MIPLRDANPVRRTPVVTIAIIVACIVAYAYRLGLDSSATGSAAGDAFFERYGLVPAHLTRAIETGRGLGEQALSVLTSMFLHVSLLHLGGNLIYLWIFGNNIEDRLGRLGFLVYYLLGGAVAALAQVAIDPTSPIPLVGASGAISAILGTYIVLFPGARVLSLVFLVFFYQLIEVPAVAYLGVWFVLQLIDGLGSLGVTGSQGGVAFFAHIGGFVAGVVVGLVIRGRGRAPGEPVRRSPAGLGVG